MPTDDVPALRSHEHRCMACDADHAPFGFNTRTGPVWTCGEHRDAGEAVLVAPMGGGG